VVGDVDLPRGGLLVLGTPAQPLRGAALVTVAGSIVLFSYDRFAGTHELSGRNAYSPYSDRKIVLADEIRSLA
jgi:hypothetical protein